MSISDVTSALEFIERQGVVLEAARGAAPALAECIANGPISGSWWGHPRAHDIFRITRGVRACDDVLVCRLIDGKITFVHRRLWPALVRLAHRFPAKRLARLRERHTTSGRHEVLESPYPEWVSADVAAAAIELSEDAARHQLRMLPSVQMIASW